MARSKQPQTPETTEATLELEIGPGLFVRIVKITDLREQDVNAQQMKPRHFERLTENVRARGALESLPYCSRPGDEGPTFIVSGHHRVRAARAAGLQMIPVIIDVQDLTRSEVVAKQIAHNELHGEPDEEILLRLLREIDNVDDLLATGLDESLLPMLMDAEDTTLALPHVEFDWRMVTLLFLPAQMREFEDVIGMLDRNTEVVGVANADQFAEFSRALLDFARIRNIKSMAAAIYALTRIAREQVAAAQGRVDGQQADPNQGA